MMMIIDEDEDHGEVCKSCMIMLLRVYCNQKLLHI